VTADAVTQPDSLLADDLPASYLSLLAGLRQGTPVDADHTALVQAAAEVWSRPGFDAFLSRPRLGFEPFDYQLQAAQSVQPTAASAGQPQPVRLGRCVALAAAPGTNPLSGPYCRRPDDQLAVIPAAMKSSWAARRSGADMHEGQV
jgi:hypothetical protein